MLTHEDICGAVKKVADEYSLARVSYFGSYAEGRATPGSDLDLLVEFVKKDVPIWTISGLKIDLEGLLGARVDVVHAPIPEGSFLEIGKTVVAYEDQR